MAELPDELEVAVWQGDRAGGAMRAYSVPQRPSQTVLDVVTWIQRNVEPGLSYRFACRVGMCGSCAMMVNGQPRWACRTHIKAALAGNHLELRPLRNLPVIKDLACDMSEFFHKWQQAEGRFYPTADRHEPVAKISPASPRRAAANKGIECINCAACYAACDVVAWNPGYLGPAALNRAWTLLNDVRDGAQKRRQRAVLQNNGCQNCHSMQGCASFCPVELNPTEAIAGLKRTALRAIKQGQV